MEFNPDSLKVMKFRDRIYAKTGRDLGNIKDQRNLDVQVEKSLKVAA